MWAGPISKFKDRCNTIYKNRLPHWLTCKEFVSKAMSVLLYVGQLALPPKNLKAFEAKAITKLLGFAPNALSFDCAFNLDFFPRPTYSVLASRIRASIKTLHSCEDFAATLRQLKEESLPFCMRYGNDFSPGWDTPPFCNNLDSAKNGKLDKCALQVPVCSIVEVIRKFQRKPFPRFQGVLYDHIYKNQFQDGRTIIIGFVCIAFVLKKGSFPTL